MLVVQSTIPTLCCGLVRLFQLYAQSPYPTAKKGSQILKIRDISKFTESKLAFFLAGKSGQRNESVWPRSAPFVYGRNEGLCWKLP